MLAALWLMLVQGALGAFDTVYYHEYRARLVVGGARTRMELLLHAARDVVYAILFCSLGFVAWHGGWALVLALLLGIEIFLTMADFVVEVKAREPVGVLAGERVTHGVMAIIYGAFLAHLVPQMLTWASEPTAFTPVGFAVPPVLRFVLPAMGLGVLLSGIRDACAAFGVSAAGFPWRREGTRP